MKFLALLAAVWCLPGCTTINDFVACRGAAGEFPQLQAAVERWEEVAKRGGFPPDMGANGHIASLDPIERYVRCENFGVLSGRYGSLRYEWVRIAAANKQQVEREGAERAAAEKERAFRASRPGDEHIPPAAYYLQLSQLTDTFAVFVFTAEHPFKFDHLAIERTSIDPRLSLFKGMRLPDLGRCMHNVREETWKDDHGFNVAVQVARIVDCDQAAH